MATLRQLVAFLLVFLATWSARASGRIEVPRGAIELRPVGNVYVGSFQVRNAGDEPLSVSRIAPRTDADDVRLPRGVVARFESGQSKGTIDAHGTGTVLVTWTPERDARAKTFYGHVMVTSSDEVAGEVAVGIAVHGGRLGELGRHLLSTLTAIPLGASVLLGALFLVTGGGRTGRQPRLVALVATLASAALALVAWSTFDADLVRADGGEGLQHVERAVLVHGLGVELFLGVDGASLPLVVLCAIAAPCGVLASWDERRNPAVFFASYLLLLGACLGALVALDAALYLGCLALAVVSVFLLVGSFARAEKGEGSAAHAAGRMLVTCGLGLAAVGFAIGVLHMTPIRTFLVDGSPVSRTWAFTELARTTYTGGTAKQAFVISIVGLGVIGGVFPFHMWLRPVLRTAPPAVAMMMCVGLTRAALLGWLRLDVGVLSDTLRWAAPTFAAVGAAGALYAPLVAMAERDLSSVAGWALVSSGGMVLAGIGSLTPQSMLGAIAGTAVSGLSVGGALLLLNALRERTGTLVVTELRGVGLEVPRMAALLMLGAAGAGALPGCAGFWTTWLLALGAIVREPGIAVALLVAAVLLAASQMVPMLRVLRGRLPESLRQGSALLAYGGHVPELRPREILTTMPIVVLVVLLGLYPSPLVKRAQAAARDLNELVSPPGPDHVE